VEAYIRDVEKFVRYMDMAELKLNMDEVTLGHLEGFIKLDQ
jgi:hypothetical protein